MLSPLGGKDIIDYTLVTFLQLNLKKKIALISLLCGVNHLNRRQTRSKCIIFINEAEASQSKTKTVELLIKKVLVVKTPRTNFELM